MNDVQTLSDAELKKEEESTFFDEDRNQPIPPVNVVAYNELRSCADLFRMFASGKLEIQPDFQRDVVWKVAEQARFIDSLVKQLPIPSMCFSLDPKTQKWKVIDGLQRMSTITSFLGSADWKIVELDDIHPLLKSTTNNALKNGSEEAKAIYSSVEDLSIPVTVIRCSYDEPSHMKYLFTIFNRLNSGGVRLNNQEIRNCIYSGKFNDLLKEIDKKNPSWAKVKKKIWGSMDRFRSIEVLLRALALSTDLDGYDGNLAGFLNGYMYRTLKFSDIELSEVKIKLEILADFASEILNSMNNGKKSLTFVEGILVGLLLNYEKVKNIGLTDRQTWIADRAVEFANLPVFVNGPRYALSSASTVKSRLKDSASVFAN
jgi:uncharacterized protein with ParB-like and HNH nuclease domain